MYHAVCPQEMPVYMHADAWHVAPDGVEEAGSSTMDGPSSLT